MTARLMRAHDIQNLEVIDYAHGEFTRRAGPGGRPAVLDEEARRMLNNELRAELADPPIDVDRLDVAAFAALLESSLLLTPVS
jgi:hypothetical protein